MFGVKGAEWEYNGKITFFFGKENGGWENIVMWDRGCCLPCALAFAIRTDKEAMKLTGVSTKVA